MKSVLLRQFLAAVASMLCWASLSEAAIFSSALRYDLPSSETESGDTSWVGYLLTLQTTEGETISSINPTITFGGQDGGFHQQWSYDDELGSYSATPSAKGASTAGFDSRLIVDGSLVLWAPTENQVSTFRQDAGSMSGAGTMMTGNWGFTGAEQGLQNGTIPFAYIVIPRDAEPSVNVDLVFTANYDDLSPIGTEAMVLNWSNLLSQSTSIDTTPPPPPPPPAPEPVPTPPVVGPVPPPVDPLPPVNPLPPLESPPPPIEPDTPPVVGPIYTVPPEEAPPVTDVPPHNLPIEIIDVPQVEDPSVENPPSEDPPVYDPPIAELPVVDPIPPIEEPTWFPAYEIIRLPYFPPDGSPTNGGVVFMRSEELLEVLPWREGTIDIGEVIYDDVDGGQFSVENTEGMMLYYTMATDGGEQAVGGSLGFVRLLASMQPSIVTALDSNVPEPSSAVVAGLSILISSLPPRRRIDR